MRPRRAITQLRTKPSHRQSNDNQQYSSGHGSPQNIKIFKNGKPGEAGDAVTQYEVVAGTSSTMQPMTNSKETSGEIASNSNFIHTSTLTRQHTGTERIKVGTPGRGGSKESVNQYGSQIIVDSKKVNGDPILLRNTSNDPDQQSQEGGANISAIKFPKLEQQDPEQQKVKNTESTVTQPDYTIVEQNDHSCLDLDTKQMEETSSIKDVEAFKSLCDNDRSNAAGKATPTYQPKKVPVTTIDFREARQYRRQRSGIENPYGRVTYKLPSYASCLRAQIRPKNYAALREYYELLAKDEKLAKINEKYFLQDLVRDNTNQSQHQSSLSASMKRSSKRNDRKVQSVLDGANRSNTRTPNMQPDRRVLSSLQAIGEGQSNFQSSQVESPQRSMLHSSEPEEMMGGVLDEKSPQYNESRRDSITYIQYGSKNVKYQMAINGPSESQHIVNQEPSVGTFVEEGQASRQALSGFADPTSTTKREEQRAYSYHNLINMPAKVEARANSQLNQNDSYKAQGLNSSVAHQSVNRFPLGKITDGTINANSQLIGGKGQKKSKGFAQSILEPVLNHTRVATAGIINSSGNRSSMKNSPGKKSSTEREKELQSATGRTNPKLDIKGDESEPNMLEDKPAGGTITPDNANQNKIRMTKTSYDVTKTDGAFLINYHHASGKKKKSASRIKQPQPINEDLALIKNGNDVKPAVSLTASDKNIEIAMRTNDIFSSQQDDEEMMINLQNNNSNAIQSNALQSSAQVDSQQPLESKLPQNQIPDPDSARPGSQTTQRGENQKVISYRLPGSFDQSQPISVSVSNNQVSSQDGSRMPVQQVFSSQGFSTMRNAISPSQQNPLQQAINITSVEISGERLQSRAQNLMSHQHATNTGSTRRSGSHETGSEVMRQQRKQNQFSKIHNQKMSLQPDDAEEVTLMKRNRNEAQTQVQVMFESHDSGATSRNEYIGDPMSVMVASHQNSVEKQNHSSSHLEGASVYNQSYQRIINHNQPHQHSGRGNINESEMLNLLDMYFGPQRQETPINQRSSTKAQVVSPQTYVFQASQSQDYDVKHINTKNYQLPTVRSRGGTQMMSKEPGVSKSAAHRAMTQHQRRQYLNKKYYRAANDSVLSSKSKNVQKTLTDKEIMQACRPKNLLQGRGNKDLGSSLDKAKDIVHIAKSLEAATGTFLNVKQLKPVKMEVSSFRGSQKHETESSIREAVLQNNSGGIKVANPSVYILQRNEKAQQSFESIHQKQQSTQFQQSQKDASPPQDKNQINQVVIPSVPNSASQNNLHPDQPAQRKLSDLQLGQDANDDVYRDLSRQADRELSKFVSERFSKMPLQQRAVNTQIQYSHEGAYSPSRQVKLRMDSGQTYSTMIQKESPAANVSKPSALQVIPVVTASIGTEENQANSQIIGVIGNPGTNEYQDLENLSTINLKMGAQQLQSDVSTSAVPSKYAQTHGVSVHQALNPKMLNHRKDSSRENSEQHIDTKDLRPPSGETIPNLSQHSPMLPKQLKTPENLLSGRGDTSEGSLALIGRTPEFLSALNDASAIMDVDSGRVPAFAQPSDRNNKDLTGVIQKPVFPEQVERKSASLTQEQVNTMLSGTLMSEGSGAVQNATFQMGENKSHLGTLSQPARMDSNQIKQPINVEIEKQQPKVTINSRESVMSSICTTTNQTMLPPHAIYMSQQKSSQDEPKAQQKINVRDCNVSNQEHAANLLQAYWPYFSGINSSKQNSKSLITSQKRPQTQQMIKNVQIQQYQDSEGAPYQPHARLMSRKRTTQQVRTWSKNGSRPKPQTTLSSIVSPRSGQNNGVQGKRFSQSGLNVGTAVSTEQVQRIALTGAEQQSPSQNKITIMASPRRGHQTLHERCPTQDLILPPGMEHLSRDFNQQLKAIQTALRQSMTTDNDGQHVIGVVGDFATLQDQPEATRNNQTKTMSITTKDEEGLNELKDSQARVYTFGQNDQHAEDDVNYNFNDDSPDPVLKRASTDQCLPETEPSQNEIRNMQLLQEQMEAMDVHLFDNNEADSAASLKPDIERNSLGNESAEVHLNSKETEGRKLQQVQAAQPEKPKTSQQKTRFQWQIRQNQPGRAHSGVLNGPRRVLDKKYGAQDTMNSQDKQQLETLNPSARRSQFGAAYMGHAKRGIKNKTISQSFSNPHGGHKLHQDQVRRILQTHEKPSWTQQLQLRQQVSSSVDNRGTETSHNFNNEIDNERPSTVLKSDQGQLGSFQLKKAVNVANASYQVKEGPPRAVSQTSIKSSNVNIARSNSMVSALEISRDLTGAELQQLTKRDIEERTKLEAAIKVQQVMEDIALLKDLTRDPSVKLRNATRKELAASIEQIYSYGRRKAFNYTQLQGEAEKRRNIEGYSERKYQQKHQASFLKKQMGESFYSQSKKKSLVDPTQELNQAIQAQKQQAMSMVGTIGDPYGTFNTITSNNPKRKVVHLGHKRGPQASVDSAQSSYQDHLQTNTLQKRNTSSQTSRSDSTNSASLIIRGQHPSRTEHQSYLVPGSVEKFISIHDQNSPKIRKADTKESKLRKGSMDIPEMERVSIKLVQTRDQSTDQSHLQQDSMQSQDGSTRPFNIQNMDSTVKLKQHKLHASITQQSMHGKNIGQQVITTEYSNEKEPNSKASHSPQQNLRASTGASNQETFVMVFHKTQNSPQKESGDNTIRYEEFSGNRQINFDFQDNNIRRNSTILHNGEYDFSLSKEKASGECDPTRKADSLMGRSMDAMGHKTNEHVEYQRQSAPGFNQGSETTLKLPSAYQTQQIGSSNKNEYCSIQEEQKSSFEIRLTETPVNGQNKINIEADVQTPGPDEEKMVTTIEVDEVE